MEKSVEKNITGRCRRNSAARKVTAMKQKTSLRLIASAVAVLAVAPSYAQDRAAMAAPSPILSVADYDGDGRVSRWDLALLQAAVVSGEYTAFYDKDADGVLSRRDYRLSRRDLGKLSTEVDRELATLFVKFGWLQNKTAEDASRYLGFRPVVTSLAGHGEHWMNDAGVSAVNIGGKATFDMIQGLNVPKDGSEIRGVFWGEAAIPLFEDPFAPGCLSTLDWPDGEEWKSKRVQAFAGDPPSLTSSEEEMWHTHAGLCQVYDEVGEGRVHQYTSFNECQAYPNSRPVPIAINPATGEPVLGNAWVNLWMIHMWFFELNPNGLFAGTNPNLDPDSPSEEETTDGRPIPEFFEHHHHP